MKEESYGIVPILEDDGEYLYLIVQHNAGHWGFPKGHAEKDEGAIITAKRELREETGISSCDIIEGTSYKEQYTFPSKGVMVDKIVTYFPAKVSDKNVTPNAEEITNYMWGTLDEVLSTLTFDTARDILREVKKKL